MKVIVVATDYSPEAENAIEYAANAAKVVGAQLVLFHLYKLSVHALNSRLGPSHLEELYTSSRRKLEAKASEVAYRFGVLTTASWHKDDFYFELKDCLEHVKADILVIGMAKKSLEQDLLGNTTTSVIHRLKHPVIAVPEGAKFRGIKTILFAADVFRGIHKDVLDRVKMVAERFGAREVEIFHVTKRVKEIEEKGIKASTERLFGEGSSDIVYYYRNVESNAVIEEIQNEIEDTQADVLIMVPYKYGFWGSLIHRSKTRIMASGLQIPLISLPL